MLHCIPSPAAFAHDLLMQPDQLNGVAKGNATQETADFASYFFSRPSRDIESARRSYLTGGTVWQGLRQHQLRGCAHIASCTIHHRACFSRPAATYAHISVGSLP